MHQEKYSLKWHTYSDHLKSMMKELMMNEDFSDVTLVTEDKKQIKANISILGACSPVFKDILKKGNNSNHIMYLRGIQFCELESIMQFIHLGEATFFEERMDEFLAVARLLEIKELCNTEIEPDDNTKEMDQETEILKEPTVISDFINPLSTQGGDERVSGDNWKYDCEPCNKTYSTEKGLMVHIQSKHEGVKYDCDLCDNKYASQITLRNHIQSIHEGVKYACNQCDYQATDRCNLTRHIKSKHEGAKYACNQCEHQATDKSNLARHIQSMHECVMYACDQCDYQATQHSTLKRHIRNKH